MRPILHLPRPILPGIPRSINLLKGQSLSSYFPWLLLLREVEICPCSSYVSAVAHSHFAKIYKQELLENSDCQTPVLHKVQVQVPEQEQKSTV